MTNVDRRRARSDAAVPEAARPPLVTTRHVGDDARVVKAFGELDMLTAGPWRSAVLAVCTVLASGALPGLYPRVVCDLSEVEYLGASGLSALVFVAERARRTGVELRVVAGPRSVDRALAITALDHLLPVHPTVEDALAAPGLSGPVAG